MTKYLDLFVPEAVRNEFTAQIDAKVKDDTTPVADTVDNKDLIEMQTVRNASLCHESDRNI
jgi:hypothetical protein